MRKFTRARWWVGGEITESGVIALKGKSNLLNVFIDN